MSVRAEAACLFDPELHDGPARTERPEERAAREAVAIEVCAECPLFAVCERYALAVQPPSGVWAGRTPGERAAETESVALGEVA